MLPKKDNETILDNLRNYVAAITDFVAAAIGKRDKLIDTPPTPTTYSGYDIAKLNIEIIEYNSRLDAQKRVLKSREYYYKNEFLPKFNEELEEMHGNWDQVCKRCEELCKIIPKEHELYPLFTRYPQDNTDLEVKNEAYKKFKFYADDIEKKLKKNPQMKVVKN